MKEMSLPEAAYEILKSAKDPLSFQELYEEVAKEAEMTPEEHDARIGQFYTDLFLDGRFCLLSDNFWDLSERHTVEDAKAVLSAISAGEEEANAEENGEENEEEDEEESGEGGDEDETDQPAEDDETMEAQKRESEDAKKAADITDSDGNF